MRWLYPNILKKYFALTYGQTPEKPAKRMMPCNKEGGDWVKFNISNSPKRMAKF